MLSKDLEDVSRLLRPIPPPVAETALLVDGLLPPIRY
jgi:hypothetical protein